MLSLILVVSGTYDQLFTYVIFAGFFFYALTALALLVLRKKLAHAPRPYRLPWAPLLASVYLLFSGFFLLNAALEKPWESLIGVILMTLGFPAFLALRRNDGSAISVPTVLPASFRDRS